MTVSFPALGLILLFPALGFLFNVFLGNRWGRGAVNFVGPAVITHPASGDGAGADTAKSGR